MPLKRSMFVPGFDSRISSRKRQKDDSLSCSFVSLERTPAPKRRPGLMLTVKLATAANETQKGKVTGPKWVLKHKVCKKRTPAASQREESQSIEAPGSQCAQKDAFIFSQGDTQPKSDKEKIKMAVLKNISRMLVENNHIRQRLVSLSQVNCRHTMNSMG